MHIRFAHPSQSSSWYINLICIIKDICRITISFYLENFASSGNRKPSPTILPDDLLLQSYRLVLLVYFFFVGIVAIENGGPVSNLWTVDDCPKWKKGRKKWEEATDIASTNYWNPLNLTNRSDLMSSRLSLSLSRRTFKLVSVYYSFFCVGRWLLKSN